MTRDEMLAKFKELDFHITDQISDELTDFMERDVWFDSEGWGSYAIDEARNDYFKCPMPHIERLDYLEDRYSVNGGYYGSRMDFDISDFEGSSLKELYNHIFCGERDIPSDDVVGLFNLDPNKKYFYCGYLDNDNIDDSSPTLTYFDTKEDFARTFLSRENYHERWTELENDKLTKWYNEIFVKNIFDVEDNYYTISKADILYYHVTIQIETGDCMGIIVKDIRLKDLSEAETIYENYLKISPEFKKELQEMYEQEIYEYLREIHITISLIEAENELFNCPGFNSAGLDYNSWINILDMDLDGEKYFHYEEYYEMLHNHILRNDDFEYEVMSYE